MFGNALRGLLGAVKTERNIRIHFAAAYYVTLAGLFFRIERWGWTAIALSCGLVIGAELLNTAIERLCDAVHPKRSPKIAFVKDAAAGAVLMCAVTAVCVAVAVFWGKTLPAVSLVSYEALLIAMGILGVPFWLCVLFLPKTKGMKFHDKR